MKIDTHDRDYGRYFADVLDTATDTEYDDILKAFMGDGRSRRLTRCRTQRPAAA